MNATFPLDFREADRRKRQLKVAFRYFPFCFPHVGTCTQTSLESKDVPNGMLIPLNSSRVARLTSLHEWFLVTLEPIPSFTIPKCLLTAFQNVADRCSDLLVF